jgi:argininosuccinate lyase
VVGRLVRRLEEDGRSLDQASAEDLAHVDPRFSPEDLDLIDPATSVRRRVTLGSGSPQSVLDQIAQIRSLLGVS